MRTTLPRVAPTVALFGKIPSMLDFVRIQHTHAAGVELDAWLQAAHQALAQAGVSWPSARLRFVYTTKSQAQCLTGVIAPSRDRAGRKFSLTVYAVVPSALFATYAAATPLACGRFLTDVEAVIELGATASREALTKEIARLEPPSHKEVEEEHVELTRRLCTWAVRDFASELFGGAHLQELELALRALMRATDGAASPVLDLPIRGPLHLSAWMALLARRARRKQPPPSLFWSEAASSPRALLCPSLPPPQVPLWVSEPARARSRLLRLADVARSIAPTSAPAPLAQGVLTLQQLFERLASLPCPL